MASKIPVVATSVGGIPKVLENGISGIIIQPKDSQSIADAIMRIIKNPDDTLLIAQKGFEKIRNDFLSGLMTNKYLNVYKAILAESG